MTVSILHNPRCSKSRQTLELLKEHGVEPNIIEYLKETPSVEALQTIIDKLGVKPRDVFRVKEKEYKESGADNADLTDTQLIEILHNYPKLIERPIVIKNDKAAIGRPPENVLGLL